MRRRLAEAVRSEVEARKRRSGVMTYDDLLTRLEGHARRRPARAAARDGCASSTEVALVDEFQDTDPIQWEIMRARLRRREATLILIGDPKQAIYSFRGADVYAYLSAAEQRRTRRRWRRTGAATRG